MTKGIIKALMGGSYGFIKPEEGEDLFFHRSNLEGVEYDALREGQEVEFEKSQGSGGRPAAVKVRLAEAEVKEELLSAEEATEAAKTVEEDSTEAP